MRDEIRKINERITAKNADYMQLMMKIESINSQKESAEEMKAGPEAKGIGHASDKQREMEIQKQFEHLLEDELQFLT